MQTNASLTAGTSVSLYTCAYMYQQWLVYSVDKIQCLACPLMQTNASLTGTSVSLYTCAYICQQWLVYSVDKIQYLACPLMQTNSSLTGTSVHERT